MMVSTSPQDTQVLDVALVSNETEFSALAPAWDALAGDIPFRSFLWAQTWWRHYGDARKELFVVAVLDDQGEVVGIAPWYLGSSPHEGRAVRFLGSGEICSDYLTVLARPDMAEAVVDRLAEWLAGEGAPLWNLIDLAGVEEADPLIVQLGARLTELGHVVDRQADLNCWRLELPDNWDEFLGRLSSSRRARTRGLLRKEVQSGNAIIHQVTNAEELERGFEVVVDLHQRRRQSLSEAGCFNSERFTAFHRDISRQLLARGRLRLLWTEWKGRPATAEYSLIGDDTVFYYLGGFEPELSEDGPGWLSLTVSLHRAVEEGYRAYDFLRGDESYKASWQAVPRGLVRVRIVGNHASARVRFAAWQAAREIKGWARQLLSRSKG